jgi:DNA primase
MWKCFGCGTGGDAVKFLRLMHPEKNFTEIVHVAAEILEIKVKHDNSGLPYQPKQCESTPESFETLPL